MVNLLQCDDMITWLHVGDAFADRLNDTGSLVSEDNGKGTLWVLAGEGVCVCISGQRRFSLSRIAYIENFHQ